MENCSGESGMLILLRPAVLEYCAIRLVEEAQRVSMLNYL